jgi:hypothetical protein
VTLAELTFPNSLERIGREAFSGCVNLKNVHIPEHAELAEDAFLGSWEAFL